ncbi:MAG: SDR family oxidoreductase [bacterium]|nr:SDR family oxidoreductase [bacterium]
MPNLPLVGTRALVTGGAVRIGRELCLALGRAGAEVVVHFRTSQDEASRVAADPAHVRAVTVQADLGDPDQVAELIPRAAAALGKPIDLLVNNASVYDPPGARTSTSPDPDLNRRVNVLAPESLARAMAAALPAEAAGCVVNLGDSRVITWPREADSAYARSKLELHGLTRRLALELAPRVRVNELALGSVLPPVTVEGTDYEHVKRNQIPTGRHDTPAEVAHALLFLAANPAITGQTVYIDGGRHLTGPVKE